MKKIILISIAFLWQVSTFAQVNQLEDAILKQEYTSDWEIFKQTDKTEIYYQYTTCEGVYDCCEMLFFKVVNKSDYTVDLSWQFDLGWREYIAEPVTSRSKRDVKLILQPGEEITASCSGENNPALIFHVREKSNTETNVLTEITIEQLIEE